MNKAIKQLRDELEKREKYWRDWNGRAANRNAKLEARIEELENPWMSVYKDPPEIGQWCLISDNGIVQHEAWQWDASDNDCKLIYFWYRDDIDPVPPTERQLWQPLPPPLEKDND